LNASTITVKRQWCTKQNKLVNYTKGRRNRTVPIPRPILELMRDRPHGPSDQLFPETCNSYGHRVLRPLMEAASVLVVTFHGLRHTFASQLYEVTKDVLLVRDTLGHTNVATTNRYLHRLNSKVTGSTDGLLAGATFLNEPASVVPLRR
jgi:integrase